MYMYIASYHILYVYHIIYVCHVSSYVYQYVCATWPGGQVQLGRAEKLLAGLGNEFLGGLEKITLANATSL